MVFRLKESTKVEDCEKSDISLINSRFQAVEGKMNQNSLQELRGEESISFLCT